MRLFTDSNYSDLEAHLFIFAICNPTWYIKASSANWKIRLKSCFDV